MQVFLQITSFSFQTNRSGHLILKKKESALNSNLDFTFKSDLLS